MTDEIVTLIERRIENAMMARRNVGSCWGTQYWGFRLHTTLDIGIMIPTWQEIGTVLLPAVCFVKL